MISDDEDLLNYTPLQRSQVSSTQKRPRPDIKPSRLSLSRGIAQSQTTNNNNKVEKKTVQHIPKRTTLSQPQPGTSNEVDVKPVIKISPSKSRRRRNSRNNTPVKSRADGPDENFTPADLARWNFLYSSQNDDLEQKPQLHAVREPEGRAQEAHNSLPSAQKRKSDTEEDMSGSKKLNGGVCYNCKFPFSSLELKAAHLTHCKHKDLSQLTRCPKGSSCSSTSELHYWIHGHTDQPSDDTFGESSSISKKTEAINGVVDVMDSSSSSSTRDFNFNGAAAPFSHQESPPPSPNFLLPSDPEEGESVPLFDLKSIEHEFAAQVHATNDLRRDSVENVRKDSSDPRSRDSIDDTRKKSVDHTSRDLLDNTRRETIDQTRRDSVDHTSRDSVDRLRRETTDNTRRETIDPTRRDSDASQETAESRTLLNSLVPNIELIEDDQLTVLFDQDNEADSSSIFSKEEEEKEADNQPPSPVTRPQESKSADSRTPDLEDVRTAQHQEGDLDDSEGDELIGSVVEEAINHVIPVMEKVMKWREETKKAALEAAPPTEESNPSPRPRRLRKKRSSPPPCIHIHFHEAAPSQPPTTSSGKELGQTSILQFFKSTKPSGESSCACGGKKSVAKEGAAAWKDWMGRVQKRERELVPLPSVSDSSQDLHSEANSRSSWRQKSEKNTCPFYKYIPDANFVVDAFNYGTIAGVKGYFLTHFHYDHYGGLRRNFAHPIYCSEITAKLVSKKIGVAQRYLNPLPMWETCQVHGVGVTLLEANHCPGSVMFLFSVKPGVTHLHVGDFRAHPSMESYTALQNCPIHTLFLDTTYCSPEYDFPPQEKILEKCVSIAWEHQENNNKTLFVVGAYTIGKERVFKAIAESLNCSIWVKSDKKMILNCINDQEILSRLTNDKTKARVHVLPMNNIKGQYLKNYLNEMKSFFTEIVGLCPTGWENTRGSSGGGLDQITPRNPFADVYIYGIPYSEHSSFSELRRFVQFIKPRKVLPTVNNGNQAARKRMEKFFSEWLARGQLFGQH